MSGVVGVARTACPGAFAAREREAHEALDVREPREVAPATSRTSPRGAPPSAAALPPLRIALAGCGTVGAALARQLLERGAPGGRAAQLVSVLVQNASRERECALPSEIVTASMARFLATPADVVVEAIGGIDPAHRIVRESLHAGRRVVTANKALVARHGASLAALALRSRASLDFEGAVGGSIPIVRALRCGAAGVGVLAIRGVLNGTSNFVLGRARAGSPLPEAVREAQRRGFAEAIPDRDLDGRDAADKIAILAWLAFGVAPHMLHVTCRPLDDAVALAGAVEPLGAVTRQLAEVVLTDAGLVASVEPTVVPRAHAFGIADDEWNAVAVDSMSAGTIVLSGPGAGGNATAGALYADLGLASAPTPRPCAARVAAADGRVLRWLLASTAGDEIVTAASPAHVCPAGARSTGGRVLYAVEASRAVVEQLTAALRAQGDRPLLARDAR